MNVEAYKQQARLLEQKGQVAEALSLYKRVLTALEGTKGIWRELPLYVKAGDLLLKMSDARSAISMYERAAKAYAVYGSSKSVIALCTKILRVVPNRTPVCLGLARLMVERGHVDHARLVLIDYAERVELPNAVLAMQALADRPAEEVRPQLEMLLELAHKAESGRIQAEAAEKARDSLAAERIDQPAKPAAEVVVEQEQRESTPVGPVSSASGEVSAPHTDGGASPSTPVSAESPHEEETVQPDSSEAESPGIGDSASLAVSGSQRDGAVDMEASAGGEIEPPKVEGLQSQYPVESASLRREETQVRHVVDAESTFAETADSPSLAEPHQPSAEVTQARHSLSAEHAPENEVGRPDAEVPSFLAAESEAERDSSIDEDELPTQEQEAVQSPDVSEEAHGATRVSEVDRVGAARPSEEARPRKAVFKEMERRRKPKGLFIGLGVVAILVVTGFGLVLFDVVSLDDLLSRMNSTTGVPMDSADAALLAGVDTTELFNEADDTTAGDETSNAGDESPALRTEQADTSNTEVEQTPAPAPPGPAPTGAVANIANQIAPVEIEVPEVSGSTVAQEPVTTRGVMVEGLAIASTTPFEVEGRQGYRVVQILESGGSLTITAVHLGDDAAGATSASEPTIQMNGDTSVGTMRFAGYAVEARAAVASDMMETLLRRLTEVPAAN